MLYLSQYLETLKIHNMVYNFFQKRLLPYFLTLLVIFSIFSCDDQVVGGEEYNSSENKLNGVIESGLQTYASLGGTTGDASRVINWNAGDEVHFLAITNGSTVQSLGSVTAEDINGVNANFVVTPPIALTNYVASYPAANFTMGTGANDGKMNLSIPVQQTYVEDGIPNNSYPMIAVGNASPLKFKGVAGVLRFDLTGEVGTTINKIVFRSTGINVSGVSDWIDPLTYVAGTKLAYTAGGGCDSVVLSCPSVSLSSVPVSFYIIVADMVYPTGTTNIYIEGSNGRKEYSASQPVDAELNKINARSLFYGSFDIQKEYDAHYIVGDYMETGIVYLDAIVTGGGNWLTLSQNAAYKASEQTQNYSGGSFPLYIHLDENLTGSERSALITATRGNGTVVKILVRQQTAIYAGPFGNYGGVSVGGPSEGTLDDSGQATPFSVQLRSGAQGYTRTMYTEAIPEYTTLGEQFASSSISSYNGANKHSGLASTISYKSSAYPAINYCAGKNRDTNGDGVLSNDEIKWYMPSINQAIGMWITNVYDNSSAYAWNISSPYWTTTKGTSIFNINYTSGIYSDAAVSGNEYYGVRCVRDNQSPDINGAFVYTDVNHNLMLGLSSLPSTAVTEVTKGIAMGDEQSDVNKTMYKVLRIARTDSKQDGSAGNEAMTWSKAVGLASSFDNSSAVNQSSASGTGCPEYYEESNASDKGSWRLPTQREMQSMWIWKDELENADSPLFEPFNTTGNGYWTATESKVAPAKAFVVGMKTAYSDAVLKSGTYSVRCVKELSSTSAQYLSVSQDTVIGAATSHTETLAVSSNMPWSAISNQSWCTVSSQNNVLSISFTENISSVTRVAEITVSNGPLTKTILVFQLAVLSPPILEIDPYVTLELKALPFVKIASNGTRTLVNASMEESFIQDAVVYVYKWDGANTAAEAMCYVPNVNGLTASVSIMVKSGNKKIYAAANTGGSNPIVDNTASLPYGNAFSSQFMMINNVLASTSSGYNKPATIQSSISSGTEGGSEGLIKAMAGGAFNMPNGNLNTTTPYNSNTRFFMSNWDGPNIQVSQNETLYSNCLFMVSPGIPLELSQTANLNTNNHYEIGLQRGIAKVSLRITADGGSTNETAGYAGPYLSKNDDGSKGRFTPWTVNGKAVWALGGINKHMVPFQIFAGYNSVVASPNYSFTMADTIHKTNALANTNWYGSYDNTRVLGTGKKYGTSLFSNADTKNAMLLPGNYTPISNASGIESDQVYAFSTENGTDFPQFMEKGTYLAIGGTYTPENVITGIQNPALTTNPAEKGWNGAAPVIHQANAGYNVNAYPNITYGAVNSGTDILYYLVGAKVFIHGTSNLHKYYAWELKYDKDSGNPEYSTIVAAKINEEISRNFILAYSHGECFYRLWVRDASAQNYEDEFLVRRNFIYDMKLDRINGPGMSIIDFSSPSICCD